MTDKLPITVLVPTKNEEANIRQCLQSTARFEKVFVIDSNSTDNTAAIAREFNAEVVQFKYDGGWPKKKNWALTNLPISTPWVCILDADECLTDPLIDEIKINLERDINGMYVQWKFYFLGKWMKYSWSHGWMMRIFRTGTAFYEDLGMRGEGGWDNEVHENLVVSGRVLMLSHQLIHNSNQDISFWISKQNQFSDWNAMRRIKQTDESIRLSHIISKDPLQRRKLLKLIYLRLPFKPLAMFIYLYLIKLGILDGKAGLYFCLMRSVHELNTEVKIYEYSLNNKLRPLRME